MSEYKTFEKLKEELGDKFEEYMYKVNIELLSKIDKAIEYIDNREWVDCEECVNQVYDILRGEDNGT